MSKFSKYSYCLILQFLQLLAQCFWFRRCKKTAVCSERDFQCLKEPLTISKNYISFTSNIRVPSIGYVDMFTMRGPNWVGAIMHFTLEMKSQRSPQGIPPATRQHFLLRRPTPNQAVVALAKSITGPQVKKILPHWP